MWQAGAALHRGVRASHYRGLSCCRAQAPDAQAQQLWLMGPVAPRHVGSSQTRAYPVSPALAGRFSTTAPPGKHPILFLRSPNIETSITFLERLTALIVRKLCLTIKYFIFLFILSHSSILQFPSQVIFTDLCAASFLH